MQIGVTLVEFEHESDVSTTKGSVHLVSRMLSDLTDIAVSIDALDSFMSHE